MGSRGRRDTAVQQKVQTIADGLWFRMQTDLLDRQRRNIRIELTNAIFEYPGIWHRRRRCHNNLGTSAPMKFESMAIVA
ncbi:hypothetical protein GCM10017559_50180 [Streptosporangium longisporum]|uniref:Transposase n=1 Tax=Streptosporangium longisporum TaxID=46187 RepID=A0ABP6KP40_9ACTN